MLRGVAIEKSVAPQGGDDVIMLDFEDRFRRRIVMTARGGTQFLLDLERPVRLCHGDLIRLDDGRRIRVDAAPEELAEIRPSRKAPLAMIAYHLGNRHVEAQLFDNRIRIRRDHVIEDMLARLGAEIRAINAPFEPLAGAYAHAHDSADGQAS